jgi:hypothetical protein
MQIPDVSKLSEPDKFKQIVASVNVRLSPFLESLHEKRQYFSGGEWRRKLQTHRTRDDKRQ